MIYFFGRFVVILALAASLAWLSMRQWGVLAGYLVGFLVLSIPLIYSYVNLARLIKFISLDRVESLPGSSG